VPGYSLWAGVIIISMLASYRVIKEFTHLLGDDISEESKIAYAAEVKINQTLFFSMIGFMITAFFLSRQFTLLLFIFLGMLTASHIRLFALRPELKKLFFKDMVVKSMTYCWVIIIAVYIALKVGL